MQQLSVYKVFKDSNFIQKAQNIVIIYVALKLSVFKQDMHSMISGEDESLGT